MTGSSTETMMSIYTKLERRLFEREHEDVVNPDGAEAVKLLELINSLAKRGYQTPGCERWRAVEMCRQIMQFTER